MAVSYAQVMFLIVMVGGKPSNNSFPGENIDRETTEMLPVSTTPYKLHNMRFEKNERLINPDITKSDSAMDGIKIDEDTLMPEYTNTDLVSVTTTADVRSDRDRGVASITETVVEISTFNYADFQYSMPTSTYKPDPNCIGMMVDMIRQITYCTDIFGNTYISSPVEGTTKPMSSQNDSDLITDKPIFILSSGIVTFLANKYELAFKRWCPNSVFCPEENDPITASNPCCIQCDCSDTCIDSGTCCLDKTGEGHIFKSHVSDGKTSESLNEERKSERIATNRPTERCVKTYRGETSLHVEITSTHTYMLIQTCPEEDNIDNNAFIKCIGPNETNLDEIVPFYSTRSERNYRNIYCAKCNNDTLSGRHWESYFSCPTKVVILPLGRTIQIANDIVPVSRLNGMNKCLLYWEPVSSEIKYCVDQSTVLSSCNSKELISLCSQNYAPVRGRNGLYRNLFCLFCNEEGTELVCDDKREEKNVFITKIAISELLLHTSAREMDHGNEANGNKARDNKADGNETNENEANVDVNCEIGLVYDHDINECIRKTCAITQVKVGEKCISVMEYTSGISLDYRLTVSLPPGTIPADDYVLDIIRTVSLLPNDDGNCKEKVLGIEEQDSVVKVQVQLIKSVKTFTFTRIQKNFRAFEDQVFQINKRAAEENAPIKFNIAKPPLAPVNEKFISLGVFSDDSNHSVDCGRTIAMSDIQFCESVLLQDVIYYSDGTVRYRNATFAPGEYVATTNIEALHTTDVFINSVYVCYDLYVFRVLESRKNVMTNTALNTDNSVMSGVASGPFSASVLHVIMKLVMLLTYIHSR